VRSIVIQGASEHNLKNISLTLPRDRLIVFTGVSGSGKSSLAHDTIYREGQRRFLESLSAYARQYLGSMERSRVERIEGLSPTVSIDQKTVGRSPRSTVGTITEVYDHLRLLFARLGTPHCPRCGREIESQSAARIADRLLSDLAGKYLLICAPVVRQRKGEYRKLLEGLLAKGHARLRIDGRAVRLDREGVPELSRYKQHTIEVVHDRLQALPEHRARLTDSVEKCLELAGGVVSVLEAAGEARAEGEGRAKPPPSRPGEGAPAGEWLFSSKFACPHCGESLPELEPRFFSFNSPHGACPECHGLGELAPPEVSGPATGLRERCAACGGSRLRPEARSVRFAGRTITELSALPSGELLEFVKGLRLEGALGAVGKPIL